MTFKYQFLDRLDRAFYWATVRGAKLNKAVTFAQAALESAWGSSFLAAEHNNLFGIKAGSWKGKTIVLPTVEHVKGQEVRCSARFRSYESWQLCIVDYYEVIASRWWFRDALNHLNDADEFLRCLLPAKGKPGWSTDPSYFLKVKKVGLEIEDMGYAKWTH